jgi:hypothetical protein
MAAFETTSVIVSDPLKPHFIVVHNSYNQKKAQKKAAERTIHELSPERIDADPDGC